jgi:hypothetical protein
MARSTDRKITPHVPGLGQVATKENSAEQALLSTNECNIYVCPDGGPCYRSSKSSASSSWKPFDQYPSSLPDRQPRFWMLVDEPGEDGFCFFEIVAGEDQHLDVLAVWVPFFDLVEIPLVSM